MKSVSPKSIVKLPIENIQSSNAVDNVTSNLFDDKTVEISTPTHGVIRLVYFKEESKRPVVESDSLWNVLDDDFQDAPPVEVTAMHSESHFVAYIPSDDDNRKNEMQSYSLGSWEDALARIYEKKARQQAATDLGLNIILESALTNQNP